MILTNGILVTNDKDNNFYENGAVYIKDKYIEDLGEAADIIKKYPDAEVIDVEGKVIMPGMICAHSHIYSTYARGMSVSGRTDDFYSILENQWWALDKQLELEDVKLNGLVAYMENISNGVTTIIDHHAGPNSVTGSLFTLGKAAEEIGIRVNLSYEVSDRDGEKKRDAGIQENIDWIKETQKRDNDMFKGLFGLHASFTLSDETLTKCQQAMEGVYDGYHVHIAEGIEDQWDTYKMFGKRVVNRLEDYGIFSNHTLAVHSVHVSPAEMDILAKCGSAVVFNPESNMGNAIGIPPVQAMLDRGIVVGLGTDAYTHDMFESMKVAKIIMSHEAADPTKGFGETLNMQFKANPEIVNRYINGKVGTIEKGALADVITIDYLPHTPFNADNWGGHLLFGVTGARVNDTIVNGKLIMKNRIIQTVDQEDIHAQSIERARKIWSKL